MPRTNGLSSGVVEGRRDGSDVIWGVRRGLANWRTGVMLLRSSPNWLQE